MHRVRFFHAVAVCLLSAGISHADITTGLIAHWPFDGDASDISGNGNHGAVVNAVLGADRDGNQASAYVFNGVDTWISVGNSLSLSSPTNQVTQTAWVNNVGWSIVGQSYNPIIVKSNSTTNAFMYRLITSSGGVGGAVNSWSNSFTGPFAFQFDNWYFVASVFDSGKFYNYVNGALADSGIVGPTSMVADTRELRIGACVPGILEVFNGSIDDVRIYDRALTPSDIVELYGAPVAVGPELSGPMMLEQNYPNPLQHQTMITYSLATPTKISLRVYDVAGRLVRSMDELPGTVGRHAVPWDAKDSRGRELPSGIYYYRLAGSNGQSSSRKLIVTN